MSKPTIAIIACGALSALSMTLFTLPAHAQSASADMQRVEVNGRALPMVTRFDVHAVCPDMASSLQGSLAKVAYDEEVSALVRVNFRLTGNKIEAIQPEKGTLTYRQAARRAVSRLDCADARNAQPQQFSFLISFNEQDEETGRPSMVAVLER